MKQRITATASLAKSVAALLGALGILFTAACTPSEADQTIGDIQAVVNEAGTVVSIFQTTPELHPPNKENNIAALQFAEAASRAVWLSASESNSTDSLFDRNEKLAGYFKSIKTPDLNKIQDPQERAATEGLASGIDILRGRLEENRVAVRAPSKKRRGAVTAIPATVSNRLLRTTFCCDRYKRHQARRA